MEIKLLSIEIPSIEILEIRLPYIGGIGIIQKGSITPEDSTQWLYYLDGTEIVLLDGSNLITLT